MKKIFSYILVVLTVCGFVGCNDDTVVKNKEDDNISKSDLQESTPIYKDYDFDAYDEFIEWFKTAKEEIKDDETTPLFEQFVDNVATEKIKIYVPYIKGIPMELRNREGFFNITLMVEELYLRPRVYYYNVYDKNQIMISQTYFTDEDDININSCSETIRSIWPTAPNVDNYQDLENYTYIYEREYETPSGNVSAMVCHLNDRESIFIYLVYENMLVNIRGMEDVLTEDFFKKLEFRPIV